VACEERDDQAEGQERGEGDAHLAGGGSVAGEQEDAGDEPRKHPDHQGDRNFTAEHRAQQERELDVAHAHPAGVGERCDEQEAGGAEGAERPFRARLERGLREQHECGRRQDDPVRDDPVRDVGGRDRNEHGAEERRHDRLAGKAERDEAGGD